MKAKEIFFSDPFAIKGSIVFIEGRVERGKCTLTAKL
jgi:hypothetical protein